MSITGYSHNPSIPTGLHDIASRTHTNHVNSFIAQLKNGGSHDVQIDITTGNNKQKPVLLQGLKNPNGNTAELIIQLIDLSDIVKDKEAHLEQERFLNSIVSNMPGMVYRCRNDKEWTMEYLSPQCLEITGYPPSDLLKNKKITYNHVIHPDYREVIWAKWQDALHSNNVFAHEYPIITASGQEKWVWEQGVGITNAQGKLIALEGIIIDITDRKKAMDTQQFQASLLDHIGDMITATDLEGNIIYVNQAETHKLGFAKEDVIGKNISIYGDCPSKSISQSQILKATLRDGQWMGEVINYDKNGNEVHLESRTWTVTNEMGKPIALCGVATDITHRKKAEYALRKSEMLFRSLVENALDAIFVMRNGEYEYLNNRFIQLTRLTLQTIGRSGVSLSALAANNESLEICQALEKYDGKTTLPNLFEFKLNAHDNSTRDLEVSAAYFSMEGEPVVICIMHDITQRKQVEKALILSKQQLKAQNDDFLTLNEELWRNNNKIQEMNADLVAAKQRAEESDKLKTAFLANMSHEIRTPMNGILGFSQLLLSPNLSPDERGEYVNIIQNCGNQLLAIINDLIDISKIEANMITLITGKENLNELINEQFLMFKDKAQGADISLSFSAGLSNAQSYIITDGTRLRQIIGNLLNNAFKFTRQGHIKFGYTLKSSTLEFFVEDSGIGIPVDQQELIFNRFRQVETELERQAGGTGLGLAISKALVNKMGGNIWVRSEPYFGSVFYFTIPYLKPTLQHETKATRIEPQTFDTNTQLNVLIAEDNEVNFIFLKELLSDLKPNIIWVTNGKDAVDRVKANPEIDMILMDIKMPIMDGYQATREIKKIKKDIPIIAQTAYSFATDRQKAMEAGCDDYISKPIDKDRFMELMVRFVRVK
jgi:PAS domain S-box-containing protein